MIELKVELGISAQRIINQVKLSNSVSEEQIAQGIEEAITELTERGELVALVKEATKKELLDTARKAVFSWEIQRKISTLISDSITNRLKEYGDSVAEKILNELTNSNGR